MTIAKPEYAKTGRRRLIMCCDGTWNNADKGPTATNVVRLARIIKAQTSDGIPQIVYYHTGVGTGNWVDSISGGAGGVGVSRNIRQIYSFIVNNYATPQDGIPSDEIFLFGFSRGAYTARAVGGLIDTIGILQPTDMGSFMEAWDWYRLPATQRDIADLDRRFPNRIKDVPIRCVGVWDTVGSLGVPPNQFFPKWHPCSSTYEFQDTELGVHVEHAFQALAIDEKRTPFIPAPWSNAVPKTPHQVIRQTWFSGVHSDVGGGYPERGASDISFLWMAAQLEPLLEFNHDAILAEPDRSQPYGQGTLHNSFKGVMRIAGVHHRLAGPGAGQTIHQSVVDRLNAGGYDINPNFKNPSLPVWELTEFERKYAWTQATPAPWLAELPKPKPSVCDWVVAKLGGG